jgi:hypothetical protein
VTDTWQLPEDWREAIEEPPPDAVLDYAVLAQEVFWQEHVMLYGRERAEELQSQVLAAVAAVRVSPRQRVARILADAGWTDAALAAGESEQQ